MSIEIFLLSLQAAGAIGDMIGTNAQSSILRKGAELEQSTIETRLNEERLAFSLASVDAMKALRQTLASQRAIFAARGTNPGAGSAITAAYESTTNASADERVRTMNLLSREASLKAQSNLAGLHALAGQTQLGQQLSQRLFQKIPFSELQKSVGDTSKPKSEKPSSSIGEVNKGR